MPRDSKREQSVRGSDDSDAGVGERAQSSRGTREGLPGAVQGEHTHPHTHYHILHGSTLGHDTNAINANTNHNHSHTHDNPYHQHLGITT